MKYSITKSENKIKKLQKLNKIKQIKLYIKNYEINKELDELENSKREIFVI